jgi:hypothetical protein
MVVLNGPVWPPLLPVPLTWSVPCLDMHGGQGEPDVHVR